MKQSSFFNAFMLVFFISFISIVENVPVEMESDSKFVIIQKNEVDNIVTKTEQDKSKIDQKTKDNLMPEKTLVLEIKDQQTKSQQEQEQEQQQQQPQVVIVPEQQNQSTEQKKNTLNLEQNVEQSKMNLAPKLQEIAQKLSSSSFRTPSSEMLPMVNITIIIPTVRRFQHDLSPAPERYLAPMIYKLWNDLSDEDKQHISFYILNADKEPELHEEVVSLATHPAVTVFTKKDNITQLLAGVGEYDKMEDGRVVSYDWLSWVASENVDAAFLMEKAKVKSPYILFLEDDVYPTTKALRKLNQFIYDMKEHDDWLFLDLYTPNLNWAPGMLDVVNEEKYPFQCCTQAMLFKSAQIDDVISYFRSHPKEPIDDNLRFYMKNVRPDLFVYAARPNLFEHVGAYSSNPAKSTGIVEHTSLDFEPWL